MLTSETSEPERKDQLARLRRLLGEVGRILVEYGLADRESWTRSHRLAFPYAIDWQNEIFDEMRDALDRYGAAYREYILAGRRLANAQHRKAQKEASDLWDET